ncbi:MAG: methyltransferase domain-containing protein [Crocinitomicaceae bacterium]|nr:class I SAM-dependent methyltransferase [Crocinitomicaceae bacterium]
MQNNLSKEELKDIIQWDVKNWKNALPFWDAHFAVKEGMKVLALGEREGGMSLYFAKKGCEVVCSDYNEMPTETQTMHNRYAVSNQIEYKQIDMRKIDIPDASFDVVVFKSVIGALGNKADQDEAIKEIYRVLKPGGAFLFAENALGSKFHQFLRKKFVKWGERWRYVTKTDLKEWGTPFSKSFIKSYGSIALFGRSEKQRSTLGSADIVFSPLTPKNLRYIYFGVFIK